VDESGLFARLPDARSMKKGELVRALERQFARVRDLVPDGRRYPGPRLAA